MVVEESQFSLAIGKQGLNVRLANRLVDWNIDVKTKEQFGEMDLSVETRRAVSALFGEVQEEEIVDIGELPDVPETLVNALKNKGIEFIETLVSMSEKEIAALDGVSAEDARLLKSILEENIEIVEEEEIVEPEAPAVEPAEAAEEEEYAEEASYECPECGEKINPEMTSCPNCGVGLSFEDDSDDAEDDETE